MKPLLALVAATLILGPACKNSRSSQRNRRQELARVNNDVIFADEFTRQLRLAQIEDLPRDVTDTPDVRRRQLNSLIDRRLLLAEASRLHVLVPSDQAERLYNRMKDDYPNEDFAKLLEEKQLIPSELKQSIRDQLLVSKLLRDEVAARIALNDQDVATYFAAHPEIGKHDERVRCSQIVQKTLPEINKVKAELTKGMLFEEAATRYSVAPEKNRGGDLGYFSRGVMPKVIEDGCYDLEVGQVSPVVTSEYGFHLFKLLDKKPAELLPLEKVREQVEARLRTEREQQAEVAFLAKLRAAAQIKINEAVLAAAN